MTTKDQEILNEKMQKIIEENEKYQKKQDLYEDICEFLVKSGYTKPPKEVLLPILQMLEKDK